MRKFLNKLTCIAMSLTCLMGCMATPAFAYSGGETGENVKAPSIFETEEEPVTVVEQDAGPLTPEGNLTVVDDYQTTFSDGTAQQFITLVSKSGAYFYLIIDRAADGDQTAHFLNMVDEADLLVLMDEEDIPEPEPEPAPAPEPEPMPEPEPEPEKEEGGAGKFVLVLLVLAGIAGGGGYFWMKLQQKKREAEENKPDPDADYREDEEEIILPDGEPEPDAAQDEEAERKAYQTSDGYEED
ncbi:hypothetical protein B5G12_13495 [Faecalibacterium sp. An58]|uniref:DUF4366 domain-containing protein n=1 Tax=Faecalibacterium sp. An58 TaxID=1965648 RepID=UPI000B585116|nr:DUF4366 domain-containing protein [Faecalibacterium sp. An58]OUN67775.1 hypothetical protein B5G12_13495 [Faecalibacterium sp. An58]